MDSYDGNYDLGRFLMGFLHFFGEEFNFRDLGISLRKGGSFFLKSRNFKLARNNLLCVENFQDEYHDIAKGTYRYEAIRSFFLGLFTRLSSKPNSDSIIAPLINLNKLK
jgi:non-canonical poly(A) RNA polymerase PAPD5/7